MLLFTMGVGRRHRVIVDQQTLQRFLFYPHIDTAFLSINALAPLFGVQTPHIQIAEWNGMTGMLQTFVTNALTLNELNKHNPAMYSGLMTQLVFQHQLACIQALDYVVGKTDMHQDNILVEVHLTYSELQTLAVQHEFDRIEWIALAFNDLARFKGLASIDYESHRMWANLVPTILPQHYIHRVLQALHDKEIDIRVLLSGLSETNLIAVEHNVGNLLKYYNRRRKFLPPVPDLSEATAASLPSALNERFL